MKTNESTSRIAMHATLLTDATITTPLLVCFIQSKKKQVHDRKGKCFKVEETLVKRSREKQWVFIVAKKEDIIANRGYLKKIMSQIHPKEHPSSKPSLLPPSHINWH